MHMSRAVAVACLTVLKWLLWIMGVLLVILAVKQQFFVDMPSDVSKTVLLGLGSLLSGFICKILAARFERGA
jgi:quinol-cytochrome oxidoreductase complex cytochrome b subunit